jgi:peptidoglycan/LPS O-acetylase OafA/YrhL
MDRDVYGGFMLRRFSRIAPPYYVALTLFALLAVTPFGFPNAAHQSTALPNAVHDYFFDLAFLTGKSPLFNASFWTLGIEWRWYLLCPLLIALYVRTRAGFFLVGGVLAVAYNFLPLTIADEGTLPCFMAGILAADIAIMRYSWTRYAWIALAIALPAAVVTQTMTTERDLGDPIWHLASFALVVAGGTGAFARFLAWRPIAVVGVASYSIYLIHGPIIESLIRAGVSPVLAGAGGLAAGFAAYYAVERPLSQPAFRKALEARLTLPVRFRGSAPVGSQA